MFCDLHIHSGHSSGTQTVEEIADEARAKGIGMISITDGRARGPGAGARRWDRDPEHRRAVVSIIRQRVRANSPS